MGTTMTEMRTDHHAPYAVVTGASSGIGLELARQFLANGFEVVMVAEDEGVHAAAAELDGGRAQPLQLDLREDGAAERLGGPLAGAGRPLDAAATNPGGGNAGGFPGPPLPAGPSL